MNMTQDQDGPTIHVQINSGDMAGLTGLVPPGWVRRTTSEPSPASRLQRDGPVAINFFDALSTGMRWLEEQKIVFGFTANDKLRHLNVAIHRVLVPPARQAQKEQREQDARNRQELEAMERRAREEREVREKKERLEREAKEKKEKEEREAALAEAAARSAEAEAEREETSQDVAEPEASQDAGDEDRMSGVELTVAEEAAPPPDSPTPAPSTAPPQRVTHRLGNREVDIVALGIDPVVFQELPEELRDEILAGHIVQQNETDDFDEEFLEAIPLDMRNLIVNAAESDRRRRDRESHRRRAAAGPNAGSSAVAEEMDPSSFFASISDPGLRSQLLSDLDADQFNALPPELQAESRALGGGREQYTNAMVPGSGSQRLPPHGRLLSHAVAAATIAARVEARATQLRKSRPHAYVQILDKAGVATLLRLMFIPQQGSARQCLTDILRHICQNKQTRAEVVSILLSVLQDGSSDSGSIERSFAHLTSRAKYPNAMKTPLVKREDTNSTFATTDISPVMVVSQCLDVLIVLTQTNPKIMDFFITEHETNSSYKPRSRKGKGKDTKASRYPINALLSLLDRKLIVESSPIMESLAQLLQYLTHPLAALAKKQIEEAKAAAAAAAEKPATEPVKAQEVKASTAAAGDATAAQEGSNAQTGSAVTVEEPSASEAKPDAPAEADETAKKARGITSPPEVPDYNLRLVVNIVSARECSSKTFKNTMTLITHLSTVPMAKSVFGEELIRQAQELGSNILVDLRDLLAQVRRAESGREIQGVALSRFSPASSDQTKLLRVITALDYIFDPKRKDLFGANTAPGLGPGSSSEQDENVLLSMYENETFGPLWSTLGDALTAVRERGNMMNIATILLPLIEVLMLVCKNHATPPEPAAASQKELMSSPAPETAGQMEGLFFRFTDEHRKVLNELVRSSPKLMIGSFSLLVKNSKVLEFDNKRNFFSRRLHSRGQADMRMTYPTLQVNVRRDSVFLDSYRSLYFKKPEEFKFGKLNVRFQNEEGVDAGGLTREWFQVLVQQIFNPNYALFNPMASDRLTYHPNPFSFVNEEHLNYFQFVGRVIGKALYENRPLDCHFSRAVYKQLLGMTVNVKDMEAHDPNYYNSLRYILENKISDSMIGDFTFAAETEAFGELNTVELVPDGGNIAVTDENKREYVKLMVEHKLVTSVKEQLARFLKGKKRRHCPLPPPSEVTCS
jgi:E3 ubiquitin-protein ligase HUWE1